MIYLTSHQTQAAYDAVKDSLPKPQVALVKENMSVNYQPYHDYSKDYFTMVVTVGGDIKWIGSTTANTLSYSKNNGTTWTTANSATTISVAARDKILWKGTPTPQTSWPAVGIGAFSGASAVRYSVEGNAMSLLFGDNFKGQTSLSGKDSALCGLFASNTNVTSAENLSLPATTLADDCYDGMFYGCTSLTTAPELSATTLADYCYSNMLSNCTSLTTAPQLPATTLANHCYEYMFRRCTNLTTAPELPATTLANYCYYNMFQDCTNLTTAPSVLPATTLADDCYYQMFNYCTSLTTAPELPATTLVEECYYQMFNYCTSLNSIKCLATDISATNCTSNWVSGVAASGTFTKASSMSSWATGINGIPSGWSVQDAS